jgi:hypothetical protein
MHALKYAFLIGFGLFLLSPVWVTALQRARCRKILRSPLSIERAWVTDADLENWLECELYALVDGKEKQLACYDDVRPTVEQLVGLGIAVENPEALTLAADAQARQASSTSSAEWFAVIVNTMSMLMLWGLFFSYAWYLLWDV